MGLIAWAAGIILTASASGVICWWLTDKLAGEAFEAELERYWRNADVSVISALRRDLYKRAGLTPMMSAPQARQNLPGL